MTGRIVIEEIRPRTPGGAPAKAVTGTPMPISAVIFKDGHDILAARVTLVASRGDPKPPTRPGQSSDTDRGPKSKKNDKAASSSKRTGATTTTVSPPGGAAADSAPGDEPKAHVVVPLVPTGNDLWEAEIVPGALGHHEMVVEAWTDRYATWAHKATVKLDAGQDVGVEIAEGVILLSSRLGTDPALVRALDALGNSSKTPEDRLGLALGADVARAMAGPEGAVDLTVVGPVPLWVDRPLALFGAWYELFPRSVGGLSGAAKRVAAVAAMGFDVLYLPPIHPIGITGRKGPNNTLGAGPDDPGSPWAIGAKAGGHTSIAPELGDFGDFADLVDEASSEGMQIALDYALQCSPDHPWVTEHPEWFHHRPDGSIAYAENPPKKYQDIYPINFWPEREPDRAALWEACADIIDFWLARGVTIFRVDNPHTKPIAFWEWLIARVHALHPEVIFLAEAFTRPKIMAKLAEVGFTQSYTYFTWRTTQHGPEGLRSYLEELAGPLSDYMRPNFWPSTPDILSGPLRNGPQSAFALRLVLAATMSPAYGVYSGYEFYENRPASASNEEYLNSEKYQITPRDFDAPSSLTGMIATLNRIRRRHPAFADLRSIRFHDSDNPNIIAYSKTVGVKSGTDGAESNDELSDCVLVVVNLDPEQAHDSILHLDLAELGLPRDRPFPIYDELSGETFGWDAHPFVRLEPWRRVAHVFDMMPESHARALPTP